MGTLKGIGMIKLLLGTGTLVEIPDRDNATPLYLAAFHGQQVVSLLMATGGNKEKTYNGAAPLFIAACRDAVKGRSR